MKRFLSGKEEEMYEEIYSYIEEHHTGLGVKIYDIARALETQCAIVRRVCQVHKNLEIFELSKSDRVMLRETKKMEEE